MIKSKLLALSVLIALFSCKNSEEQLAEKPTGWEILETPVQSSLRGLSPLTNEIAWASGSNGTWLRTIDGGKSWDHGVVEGLDTVDFRSIYAFDAMTALVVSAGQPAVIYKTTDGGQSWKLKHQENEYAFLDGISFSSPTRGFVIGDPNEGKWTILQTANQGDTWYPVDSLPEAAEGEAAFAASATSLLAEGNSLWIGTGGTQSNLHFSKDMGAT
ncbi:MAG: YCF48-related protein, partial [Algoriphagus sp.]